MTLFQQLGLALVSAFAALACLNVLRSRGDRLGAITWLAVWLGAGIALVYPDLTRVLAGGLGIERGADLVFYSAVLAMLVGFFMLSLRLRRISREITLLVRHLALESAAVPPESADGKRDHGPASGLDLE